MIWQATREEPPVDALESMRHPVPVDERGDDVVRRQQAIARMERAMKASPAPARLRPRAVAAALGLCGLAAGVAFASVRGLDQRGPGGPPAEPRAGAALPAAGEASSAALRVEAGVVVARPAARAGQVGDAVVLATAEHRAVVEGDEIHSAPDARATLALPRGVSVGIESSTRTRITSLSESDQRIRLDVGKVDVSVPNPGGPSVFVVDAPDAQVVVHGTLFSVQVARKPLNTSSFGGPAPSGAEGPTETRVSVTRGSVLVVHARGSELVSAGGAWSSAAPVPSAAPAPVVGARGLRPASQDRPRVASVPRPTSSLQRSEALAEQNRLFQASLDARKAGDDGRVVALLDELLARFPDTELGPEARLSRLRAKERLRAGGSPGRSGSTARPAGL